LRLWAYVRNTRDTTRSVLTYPRVRRHSAHCTPTFSATSATFLQAEYPPRNLSFAPYTIALLDKSARALPAPARRLLAAAAALDGRDLNCALRDVQPKRRRLTCTTYATSANLSLMHRYSFNYRPPFIRSCRAASSSACDGSRCYNNAISTTCWAVVWRTGCASSYLLTFSISV